MSVSEKLLDEGIRLPRWSVGDYKIKCPKCQHERRKNKGDEPLSVTLDPDGGAVWKCHHCGWAGNVPSGAHADRFEKTKSYSEPRVGPKAPDKSPLLEWFEKRGVGEQAVKCCGVELREWYFGPDNPKQLCVAFPYIVNGQLVNVKYRAIDKKDHRQEKNPLPSLFMWDTLDLSKPVIFVEGEPDVVACAEAGIANVTTIPGGAPNADTKDADDEWGKRLEPLTTHADGLAQVPEFWIATDNDPNGNALAELLARRLGRDKCKRVRFPDSNDVQCKDANDCLLMHGPEVLRECIQGGEAWPVKGLYEAKSFFVDVWDLYHGRGPKPLEHGFPTLARFYKTMPGDFCLVTGIPNHGKSNFLDQISIQMAQKHGWKFVVFSPEHKAARHIIRLAEKFAGQPFQESVSIYGTPRINERRLKQALDWIQERFLFIRTGDEMPTIENIIEAAKGAVLRHGINGLILDPYNEIEQDLGRNQSETQWVSKLISRLKAFGQDNDVASWLVAHPQKPQKNTQGIYDPPTIYDCAGSAHFNNKADAGLSVYRNYEKRTTEVYIRKIREQPECGMIGMVEFSFDPTTRRYTETGEYEAA